VLTLDGTTDTIEVSLASAHTTNPLHCVASWRDKLSAAYTPGKSLANTNGTTPVVAVAAPAASTQRAVDAFSVYNSDTVSHLVTVKYDANGTEYTLFRALVGPGATLHYIHDRGWRVLTPQGAFRSANTATSFATPTAGEWRTLVLGADVANDSIIANLLMPLDGLAVPVKAGQRYVGRWTIFYTTAATATGSRWILNGAPYELLMHRTRISTSTTNVDRIEGASAYVTPNGASLTSAATAANGAIIDAFIHAYADGFLTPQFSSEVLSSAVTAKRGSFVEFAAV